MTPPITSPATAAYILAHREEDIRRLALHAAPGVDMPQALEQIAGWQSARHKLPTWAQTAGVVFPPRLSMEQCSSEATAQYKCGIVRRLLPSAADRERMVDITGGFGVDFSFLAPLFGSATYVEQQQVLCHAASHNLPLLGVTGADVVCADGVRHLHEMPPATMLYADPARRDAHGGKTFAIADCTPDVSSLRGDIMRKCRMAIIKLSPMLDWHKAVQDMAPWVSEVHILAVRNECKELLLVLNGTPQEWKSGVTVHCSHLTTAGDRPACHTETFQADDAAGHEGLPYAGPQPGMFLYEPNAAIMKGGFFSALSSRYGLRQVSRDSHLLLSGSPVVAFPGRTFRIQNVVTMNKKEVRKALAGITRANITTRNFPLSADSLRQRLKLKDGGDTYIFATTTAGGDHLLAICSKED